MGNENRDFRDSAEAGTLKMLEEADDMVASGCVRVLKNRTGRYVLEAIFLTISTLCLLNSFLPLPLGLLGVIPFSWVWPMLLGGLAVLLVMRVVKSFIIKIYLHKRPQSLLKYPGLESRPIAIEDGNTYKKVKILTEDEGFCLFAPEQCQLLIEGIMFRYIIFAEDVISIEPVSGYAMGGARIKCIMGGVPVDFVMSVAGQGPVTSLIEAFNPKHNALGLSTRINQALFGLTQDAYRKPPAMPV